MYSFTVFAHVLFSVSVYWHSTAVKCYGALNYYGALECGCVLLTFGAFYPYSAAFYHCALYYCRVFIFTCVLFTVLLARIQVYDQLKK